MGLGGNVTHCLEKFVACLERAECTALPMYVQATTLLADPVANAAVLNPPVQRPSADEAAAPAAEAPREEL